MPSLSKEELAYLGQQVATDFFNQQQDLNEGVTKVAAQHGLSSEQVARVCERANHAVFSMSQEQGDPTQLVEFPVAHPEKVAGLLDESEYTHAATTPWVDGGAYHAPPPTARPAEYREPGSQFAEMFAHDGSKQAADRAYVDFRDALHEHVAYMDKLAEAQSQVRADMVSTDIKRQNSEESFYQWVRQQLLEGRSFKELYDDLTLDGGRVDPAIVGPQHAETMLSRILGRLKAENLVDEGTTLPGRSMPPVQHTSSADDSRVDLSTKQASEDLSEALRCMAESQVLLHAMNDLEAELHEKRAEYDQACEAL